MIAMSVLEANVRHHMEKTAGKKQVPVEALCLLILALRRKRSAQQNQSVEQLLSLQFGDGSWPALSGTESEGCWVTALGAIVLMATGRSDDRLAASIQWLTRSTGREANWFWQWKFKTLDTSVQFDPSKFGWSWIHGTTSWVIPTAFALVALRRFGSLGHKRPQQLKQRVATGVQMLIDRACPGGGWNAGNSVAFGVPYSPYIDATAIALIALREHENEATVQASLTWLQKQLPGCRSPFSLAWGILTLTAFQKNRPEVVRCLRVAVTSLAAFIQRQDVPDESCTIAVCLLAMEAATTGQHVFEVSA